MSCGGNHRCMYDFQRRRSKGNSYGAQVVQLGQLARMGKAGRMGPRTARSIAEDLAFPIVSSSVSQALSEDLSPMFCHPKIDIHSRRDGIVRSSTANASATLYMVTPRSYKAGDPDLLIRVVASSLHPAANPRSTLESSVSFSGTVRRWRVA
jgi:hypothetical protein